LYKTIYAKLVDAIRALQIMVEMGWHSPWIECDSMLVVQAVYNHHIVP